MLGSNIRKLPCGDIMRLYREQRSDESSSHNILCLVSRNDRLLARRWRFGSLERFPFRSVFFHTGDVQQDVYDPP